MKKFKHKKLGRIAFKKKFDIEGYSYTLKDVGDYISIIPKELVENSDEWEEIAENDTAYNGMVFSENREGSTRLTESFLFDNYEVTDKFRKKVRAMKAVRKRHAKNDGDFVPDWEDINSRKYYLHYSHHSNAWKISSTDGRQFHFFLPYFSSPEKGQQCIEELGEQLDDLLL